MVTDSTISMPTTVRHQPLLAAHALLWSNRWRRVSWRRRVVAGMLLVCVVAAIALSIHDAARWRVDPRLAMSPWLMAGSFALWTAFMMRRRFRHAVHGHHRGWMQAWPVEPQALMVWLAVIAGTTTLLIVLWPALMAGLTLSVSAGPSAGLNLAACVVGLLAGVGLARRPRISADPAAGHVVPALVPRQTQVAPFLGLSQLRGWQKRASGYLSLRRWTPWVLPVLLAAPSSLGIRGGLQILLLVLVWPLYARAMAVSLQTITTAANLLAGTPLPMRSLWHELLPRPLILVGLLVIGVAMGLSLLGFPPGLVAGVLMVLALLEGGRIAHCCWHASGARVARVRSDVSMVRRKFS